MFLAGNPLLNVWDNYWGICTISESKISTLDRGGYEERTASSLLSPHVFYRKHASEENPLAALFTPK